MRILPCVEFQVHSKGLNDGLFLTTAPQGLCLQLLNKYTLARLNSARIFIANITYLYYLTNLINPTVADFQCLYSFVGDLYMFMFGSCGQCNMTQMAEFVGMIFKNG